MMRYGPVEVVTTAAAILGEGPVWDHIEQRLLWVDIPSHCVHAYEPAERRSLVWQLDRQVSALCLAGGDRYVAATESGIAELELSTGRLVELVPLPSGDRMNDAKADPAGRLVGGTYKNQRERNACGLYRFERDGVVQLASGTVPNGLEWSPDGSLLYFVDSATQRIDVFDYDVATGEVSGRRLFADLSDLPGVPDGLTVDEDGHLWVAIVRGGSICRLDPCGRREDSIALPVKFVTSCAFGGSELRHLYITSGSIESVPGTYSHALGGALFRVETPVRGIPVRSCQLLENLGRVNRPGILGGSIR